MVKSSSERFAEIYLSAPVDVCKRRDTSGLYRLAETGEITHLSGVSAPYETPTAPDLIVPTDEFSVDQAVALIMEKLIVGRA